MADQSGETSEETAHPENDLKKKRTQRSQSRRRVTLSIKRIREIIDKGQVQDNKTRVKKEIQQLRKDYEIARQQNGELYDLVEEEERDTLDQWEIVLANDVFSIEAEVEGSLIAFEDNQVNTAQADYVNGSVQNASNASGSGETTGHASNASGSGETTGHASNASGSGETTGHASNASGSGETTGHTSNASGSEETTGHASNASGSGETTGHTSNASGSEETTGHASNASGSGEDSSHAIIASNENGSATITSQAIGANESSSTQIQASPSLDLTVIGNHASKTLTSHGNAQQSSQISRRAYISNLAPKTELEYAHSFDAWIDDLIEFQETLLPKSDIGNVTIADALFKLEANKDIPSIQLPSFDGDALSYTDFIDQFKVHIHDKLHLKDDT